MTVKHKDPRENDDDGIGEQSEERTALTTDIFVDLLNDVKTTISEKTVFKNAMRDEISSYRFNITEGSKEVEVVQSIFNGLTKNGNAEKFYSKYYATVALRALTYFPGQSRNSSTLLATKFTDRLLGPVVQSPIKLTLD